MATRNQLTCSGLAILSLAAAWTTPAWSQAPSDQCPGDDKPAQIEALDFSQAGNTCDLRNDLSSYQSKRSDRSICRIQTAKYPGNDAIYKVWLHKGNTNIAFHLDVEASADLVLALIKPCGNDKCVSNNGDNFDPKAGESIPAASYEPGIYYLVVDSAKVASCGRYTLTVTGTNPTPNLVLELTSSPKTVVAGTSLTYTLTVKNQGDLPATGVKIIQTLPEGVKLPPVAPNCTSSGRTVSCSIGDLAMGASAAPRTVKVEVNSATLGMLRSTAEAKAVEGDRVPPDNKQSKTTPVIAKSDLAIEMLASKPVVAGMPLTYTLSVRNDGPSDATEVVVTDTLPAEVLNPSATGCTFTSGKATCRIPKMPARGPQKRFLITGLVKPSARDPLGNTANVTAPGLVDPGPGPNSATLVTPVIRKTDLSITKTAQTQVNAGDVLSYNIAFCNCGPSESSSATITDSLPSGVKFLSSASGCTANSSRTVVTCPIDSAIAPGACTQDLRCAANTPTKKSFLVRVDASLESGTKISNKAKVAANTTETDPNPINNDSNAVTTNVAVEADLGNIVKDVTAVPPHGPDICVGENLLYKIAVSNLGPSNSRGGVIKDMLPDGLVFVSSPTGCRKGSNARDVTCVIPPLEPTTPPGPGHTVYIVAMTTKDATISNQASVESSDDHQSGNNKSNSVSTTVKPAADLEVTLSDSPDPVVINDPTVPPRLTYTLGLANAGPSAAKEVEVKLTLPALPELLGPECNLLPDCATLDHCILKLRDVSADSPPRAFTICIVPPSVRGEVSATAVATTPTCERRLSNNKADAVTVLAETTDAELAVTQKVNAEVAVAGELLIYTIEVVNHGPASAAEVSVQDTLPSGVTFSPADNESCQLAGNVVTCPLGTLEKGKKSLTLTVKVDTNLSAAPQVLSNKVEVSSTSNDPNSKNDSATVSTPVAPPLVLPFFQVNSDPAGVATFVAVKNPSTNAVGVHYEYSLADGVAAPEEFCLPGKATRNRNLRNLEALRDHSGHIGIMPVDLAACPATEPQPNLSGDFIQLDSANGLLSGLPLVSTDASRLPSELCRHWSVRLLNDQASGSSTDFLFFLPASPSTSDPVATGKVFTKEGNFVQDLSIMEHQESFRRNSASTDLGLLANFGSVEWEFPEGMVGNVSAVYKVDGKYAVAVPGFCRDGDRGASGTSLIVPYFEVDPSNGATTLFAVRNETEGNVDVAAEYFSAGGTSLKTPKDMLAAHATLTVNLRDVPGLSGQGYVQITGSGRLSGDFVFLASSKASGGALVDTDPDRKPPQLCQRWDVRFLENLTLGTTTDFIFYIKDNTAANVTGQAYREDGGAPVAVSIPAGLKSRTSFRLPASGLPAVLVSGSLEWNLGDGVLGNVAAIFTRGGSSVLIPGVCRDEAP
jgi:uncharacterized repeat protein (TIGR01451 family)